MIYYFCPDLPLQSSGMRLLYKHVAILNRHGEPAAILHQNPGFRLGDVPDVPIKYLSQPNTLRAGDIVTVPEGWPNLLSALHQEPVKLVVIAQNWKYIYSSLAGTVDWRNFGVRQAMANSPLIAEMVSWAMQIPAHLVTMGIDSALYQWVPPAEKKRQVVCIARKAMDWEELKRLLHSRNPAYLEAIEWKSLDGLSQADYAREIGRSQLYVNLSYAEGFPFSLLEAMRAGTLVAGYNSVGGQRELVAGGALQNCILSENLDYFGLARQLEPVLQAILKDDLSPWDAVISNGFALSSRFTIEEEDRTAWAAWQQILVAI